MDASSLSSLVPVALTIAASAVTGLAVPASALATWCAGIFGNLATGLFQSKADAQQQSRAWKSSFLTNDQITAFTGQVLAALTTDFARGRKDKAPLLALADSLPGWWIALCHGDREATHALSGQQFVRSLAEILTSSEPVPPLREEDLLTLLRAASSLPDATLRDLADYILHRFPDSLATGLTKLDPVSDEAFRATLLRSQAETITGIRTLTSDFNAFLDAYIQHTDGLQDALALIQASLFRVESSVERIESHLRTSEAQARREDYLANLVAGFRAYNELGMDEHAHTDDKSPAVWDIYVTPAVTSERPLSPEEMDSAQSRPRPSLPGGVQPLLPLLADPTELRTVLLADPGMGKSMLIQRLTAGIAQGYSTPGATALDSLTPIPIILRDIVPHLPDDHTRWTWDILCETMRQHYERTAGHLLYGPWETLRSFRSELLSCPSALFLVDGLDEIGHTHRRLAIRDALWEGFRRYPRARWLVTSRIIGYDLAVADVDTFTFRTSPTANGNEAADLARDFFRGRWGPVYDSSFSITTQVEFDGRITGALCNAHIARRLYLAPFDNTQQDRFIANWSRERATPDHPPGLMHQVRTHGHDGIRVLARVPNLLSYIAILKREKKPLPDGRSELYTAIARAYLYNIDRAYRLSAEHGYACPIPLDSRIRLLAILAAEMQRRRAESAQAWEEQNDEDLEEPDGNIIIGEADLRDLLQPPLARLLPGCDAARELTDFLHFVSSRSGLLLPRGTGPDGLPLYGFTHLSFLEYFAACYLAEELRHYKDLRSATADATEEGLPFDEAQYLIEFPRGPITQLPSDLPELAARPEWSEILIFLAEFSHDRPRERAPLLRQLFPALHSTDPIPLRERVKFTLAGAPENETPGDPDYQPLLPLTAATLAVRLTRDAHLALPASTIHAWTTRLWDAWLSWRVPAWAHHPWPIQVTLFAHPDHEATTRAALHAAAALHPGLTSLNISGCPGLTDAARLLAPWPGLDTLSLINCRSLSAVDHLPTSLTKLYLHGCTGLSAVDHLPASLTELDLTICTGLRELDQLPTSLTGLYLGGCTGLSAADQLPASLTRLYLTDCTGLSAVDHLPTSLTWLDLAGCTGLSAVDHLPASLTKLHLDDCTGLRELDQLPASLKELRLSGCTGLDAEGVRKLKASRKWDFFGAPGAEDGLE